MSQNDLVKLVGLTYEAVDDPLAWEAFLTKFAESVHADIAGLLTQDKWGRWVEADTGAVLGIEDSTRKAYAGHYVSLSPWLPPRRPKALENARVLTGE